MDNDHTDMSCHITYCSQLSGMSIFISSDILPHLRDKPDNGDNKCMEIAVPMNVPKARYRLCYIQSRYQSIVHS